MTCSFAYFMGIKIPPFCSEKCDDALILEGWHVILNEGKSLCSVGFLRKKIITHALCACGIEGILGADGATGEMNDVGAA